MRILHVVGTRPNLVKMAPVIRALQARFPDWRATLVHTGQHYDREMSEIFFDELGVPEPEHALGVGSGSHAQQTARVLDRLEPILAAERPDLVVVPGDVNSTLAAALTAAKLEIPVAHVESGLRSFDRSMPEELNRVLTDHLAELLFVHCDDAVANLAREGIAGDPVRFVGNTMIDTLVALEGRFRARGTAGRLRLEPGSYLLVTLHRPALVDGPLLGEAMAAMERVGRELPVIFPVHPRTRKALDGRERDGVRLLDPIGYLDFLSLEAEAAAVLTDSGGIQEETTYLGVPCFTLRENTERPITIERGTNTLLGLAPERIAEIPALLSRRQTEKPQPPPKWDGRAAERVADVLADW
jgi:UDP-N-acetylglucosamine 2-epimerase (non-hydrolysing)